MTQAHGMNADQGIVIFQKDEFSCAKSDVMAPLSKVVAIIPQIVEGLENGRLPYELALSEREAVLVNNNFEIPGFEAAAPTFISPTTKMNSLSYKIHTGRELVMMLDGVKPFAHFLRRKGETFEQFCSQPFFEYVEKGEIFHSTLGSDDPNDLTYGDSVYDCFFLPGQEWRVECLAMVMRSLALGIYSASLEFIEGTLLGYTEEENIEFLKKIKGISI